MPTTTPYPNGQALVSSALTQQQINILLQSLTCGMLGLPLPTTAQPAGYSAVRIDWPTDGQPFVATPLIDGCFLACTTEETPYTKVRNRTCTGDGPVIETWGILQQATWEWLDTYCDEMFGIVPAQNIPNSPIDPVLLAQELAQITATTAAGRAAVHQPRWAGIARQFREPGVVALGLQLRADRGVFFHRFSFALVALNP